jgi:sialic acid synthase SpsE
MSTIKICNTLVGESNPTYFIADIAANHDGNLNRAIDLIHLAKEAGADAAKFQNFKAAKIVSAEGFSDLKIAHQSKWTKSVLEVYEDATVPDDWTAILKKECDKVGIDYFSSPYDYASVDHLEEFVDVYKIGSGDVTWTDMLVYIAQKNKPVLLATGAATLTDVQRAVDTILPINKNLLLMQCNTNYTAKLENFKYIQLRVLETYKLLFPDLVLGLSDHTPGHATVLGAIALNARVIEKHFTDDNLRDGPDHKFAMNPASWKEMVDRSRELELALGGTIKKVEDNELDSVVVQQRSLRCKKDLDTGHEITEEDLEALRPAPKGSFKPYEKELLIGRTLTTSINKGMSFTMENITT